MSLKCGIVGLPNVGKSTLFNCLSSAKAQSANFPFCTIEPNIGTITVPDPRLNKLEELVNPERVVPNTIEIVDIAGLVKGASEGEGLGNQFLGNIRETDAILHVIRCFDDGNIIHVEGDVDPKRDKEIIDIELQLKDYETVTKRIEKSAKIAKTGNKEAQKLLAILEQYKEVLNQGKSARIVQLSEEELVLVKDLNLLTTKPVLYVCNVDEASAVSGNDYVSIVKKIANEEHAEILIISAQLESDIAELDDQEERDLFLEDAGLTEPGVNKLIRSAYDALSLRTYFTAGVKEVRAWTILKGMTAPQAAGVIHTDFEKGFIRAEVIAYNDFVELGSESACRDAGKLSVEGKEYVVEDGDLMHFRFNV
ncbi:MAG: GTP-binding protein YchF [Saprospiraceae bacterium]|jgi:GTP-binding protein YchF